MLAMKATCPLRSATKNIEQQTSTPFSTARVFFNALHVIVSNDYSKTPVFVEFFVNQCVQRGCNTHLIYQLFSQQIF